MVQVKRLGLVAIAMLALCGQARAMAEEDFGDAQLSAGNYKDWPNIMPLLHHTGRVYHIWVNGNEQFYYVGNTDSLNSAMKEFAGVTCKVHEVVLRPAPGVVKPFERPAMNFNWRVQIIGGIAHHMTTLQKGDLVWPDSPVLSVYVGRDSEIELEKLEVPANVKLIQLADLKARAREAMSSSDQTVRGWSAGYLGELDPHDREGLDAIAMLLKDPIDWVRTNAAGAISIFGKSATCALPSLRAALETKDEPLKKRIEETIAEIEAAPDKSAVQREHEMSLKAIDAFVKAHSKSDAAQPR